MNVLLSIKPKYVNAIIEGKKRYEFRKVIFKSKGIERVYIYATSPVKKITGFFDIEEIFQNNPSHLWENFKDESGLTEKEFFSYFNNTKKGFAIKINNYQQLPKPIDPIKSNPKFIPPQSFYYINPLRLQIDCNYKNMEEYEYGKRDI